MIKSEVCGADPEGGKLYRLIIDGKTVREDLPLDEVIRAINARDEESLGADHAVKLSQPGVSPGESPSRCAAAPFYPEGHERQGGQKGRVGNE